VAEVVLGLLLGIVVLGLGAAGGWYWLKRRGPASGTPAASDAPQGFDNITFRDVRPGVKGSPACPRPRQTSIFLKAQQIPASSPEPALCQHVREVQRALPLIGLRRTSDPELRGWPRNAAAAAGQLLQKELRLRSCSPEPCSQWVEQTSLILSKAGI